MAGLEAAKGGASGGRPYAISEEKMEGIREAIKKKRAKRLSAVPTGLNVVRFMMVLA